MRQVPMAKDEPTYSEAVRAAAAEAAAAHRQRNKAKTGPV
jgi:hypothetical protein